jgi:hypothetical protein
VAKTKFEDPETTIDEKKSIFTALGWNYIVKDKKLYISANDWLEPIEKKKKSVEEEINRLELEKTFTLKGQNTRLGVLCPVLRAVVNEVRTAIMENKGYIYIPDLQNSTPH